MTVGAAPVSFHTERRQTFLRISPDRWTGEPIYNSPVSIAFRGLEILSVHDSASRSAVGYPRTFLTNAIRALDRVTYLRAQRLPPRRQYERDSDVRGTGLGASGQRSAAFLHDNASQVVRTIALSPTPQTPAEASTPFSNWATFEARLIDAVGSWMNHLGLAHGVRTSEQASRLQLMALMGEHPAPLTDVGFGLSQVLPVLLAGLTVPDDGLFIVEQPEAQLHPRSQAALADFFCSLAKAGITCIVETHSEAFFHRLRLRAAMDANLAEQLGIYFLPAALAYTECSAPQAIAIRADGDLMWPEGFFTEGLEQELAIAAIRAARPLRP